jgi:hypothetical protein
MVLRLVKVQKSAKKFLINEWITLPVQTNNTLETPTRTSMLKKHG